MAPKKTTRLRELIYRDEILIRPGVAVALHAKMCEAAGFEAVGVSGALTAAYTLGLPDAGLITMTEMVENVRRVSTATNIPVMADCDTGFGNAINVRRTVQEVIRAGAAGLFIEDQVSPKRCGFVKGKELISIPEAVGKYRSAVDARNELDPDFIIMARTDSRTAVDGGMDEVIKRARAYREAGVDVIYVEALQSIEEMKAVRAAIDGPLACSPQAMRPEPTLQQLQDLGMCMTLGLMYFMVGITAEWDMLMAIRERGLQPYVEYRERIRDHPLGNFRLFDLVGFPEVRKLEERYLQPEQLAKYDRSLGLYEPGA